MENQDALIESILRERAQDPDSDPLQNLSPDQISMLTNVNFKIHPRNTSILI